MPLQSGWINRTIEQERIVLDKKTNFHYIRRGVEWTPPGTEVQIVACNGGIITKHGTVKGTVMLGLINHNGERKGQMIAWSYEREDLELFVMEYDYILVES